MQIANGGGSSDSDLWCALSCGAGCLTGCEFIEGDNHWLAGAASMIVSVAIGYFVLGPALG